jgi:hypothetical protein
VLVERFNHAHGLDPLEFLHELPQQSQPIVLALLAQDDQRRGRVRHSRLERLEQSKQDIGVPNATQRAPEAIEAVMQIFDRFSPLCIAKQRQQLAHATGRYTRIVNAGPSAIEHAGQSFPQRMDLHPEQNVRRNESKHFGHQSPRESKTCNQSAEFCLHM